MQPVIDHLRITVQDVAVAIPFYDKLLPLLGFTLESKTSAVIVAHECHVVEYSHPRLAFAITSPRSVFPEDDQALFTILLSGPHPVPKSTGSSTSCRLSAP